MGLRDTYLVKLCECIINGVQGGEVWLVWVHLPDQELVQGPCVILMQRPKIHTEACSQVADSSLHT